MTHKTVVVFEADWEFVTSERDRLRAEVEVLKPLADSAQKAAEQITAMTAELHDQRDEIERLRGMIKTYREMLRYDWIAAQDRQIKELNAEIDALRGEGDE